MSSPRKPTSFVPNLTVLENREVPAVASVQLLGGVLSVMSDNNPTSIVVNQTTNNITVRDVTSNNRIWSYSASQVSRVDVFGGASADALTSRGPASGKLVRLIGRGGSDILTGGDGREVLKGGQGADTLKGGDNNDKLFGGRGNNTLFGGGGDNSISAGDGNNYINGGSGINTIVAGNGNNTIICINDSTGDEITTGSGFNILWVDDNGGQTDLITNNTVGNVVNAVTAFANPGADRTLDGEGDNIEEPELLNLTDVYERFSNRPLFGPNGPTVNDIKQGALGDCYMLAGLGAVARQNPNVIRANVVDFGDGTYGVHLGTNFYRVDNLLPVARNGDQRLVYTALGEGGSVWVSVIEKAFAAYRTGANSYFSIDGGFTTELLQAFRLTNVEADSFHAPHPFGGTIFTSATELGDAIAQALSPTGDPTHGKAPTIGIQNASTSMLLDSHQYIVVGVQTDGFGQVANVVLRNPWGFDGGAIPSGNPTDGIITIDINLLFASTGYCSLEFADIPAGSDPIP